MLTSLTLTFVQRKARLLLLPLASQLPEITAPLGVVAVNESLKNCILYIPLGGVFTLFSENSATVQRCSMNIAFRSSVLLHDAAVNSAERRHPAGNIFL